MSPMWLSALGFGGMFEDKVKVKNFSLTCHLNVIKTRVVSYTVSVALL